MTDQSVVDERPDTPEGDTPGEQTQPLDGERKPPREQRYRLERNEARAERDALAERLQQLQTAELHRQASEYLAAPEDIGLSGKTLGEYLTPEGWVDRDAVAEAAASVIESRPGLAKSPTFPAVDFTQGLGSETGKGRPTWADLLSN